MGRKYKGNNLISKIIESTKGEKCYFKISMQPKDVNLFNKLLEAHTHIVFPAPLHPSEGLVSVHTTPDMLEETEKILKSLPIEFEIVEQI